MNIINAEFDIALISKYRTQLMGIAAFGIIIGHFVGFGCYVPNSILRTLLIHGSLGVDIFLFLSGLGCWYSLNKLEQSRSSDSIKYLDMQWWKKRFVRIIIPYTLCLVLLECTKGILYGEFDIVDEIYFFSTLKFWTSHEGFWFVALLVPLYFFTPTLYIIQNRFDNRITFCIILLVLILALTSIEVDRTSGLFNEIIFNIQYAFKRSTNYIIGITVAPYCKSNKRINPLLSIAVFGALFVAQCVIRSAFDFYLFCNWALTPILLIIFCYVLRCLNVKSKSYMFFTWLGAASLESYLTNGGTQGIATWVASCYPDSRLFFGRYLEYGIVVVLGLILTYVLHVASQRISKKINY